MGAQQRIPAWGDGSDIWLLSERLTLSAWNETPKRRNETTEMGHTKISTAKRPTISI